MGNNKLFLNIGVRIILVFNFRILLKDGTRGHKKMNGLISTNGTLRIIKHYPQIQDHFGILYFT